MSDARCTICNRLGHRASKCPLRRQIRPVAAVLGLALLTGCAVAVPPDTLCQLPRPRASLNDTPSTQASQASAGMIWDSRCTLIGGWGS